MLAAIARKALADIRSRPLQSALLVLVVGLAATALTVSFALREASNRPFDGLMEDSNGAHAWFYGSDPAVLRAIGQQPGVEGVSGPFPRLPSELTSAFGELVPVNLWGMDTERPEVARPVLTSGRWLQRDGEVVLEAGLANDLELGDGHTIEIAGQRLEIVGTALTPARLPYPEYDPGNLFVLSSTIEALDPDGTDWEIGIQLEEPGSSAEFVASAMREHRQSNEFLEARDWQSLRSDSADTMAVQVVFFTVFSAFAIAAVALIIANAVSGAVLAQYHEVGILKAVGFTPRHVAAVFLSAQASLAAVAGLLGVTLGFVLAPLFVTDIGGVLGASRLPAFDLRTAGIVIGAVIALAATFAAIPAWAGGRVPAVRAISGNRGTAASVSRSSRLATVLRLPPVARIGVKDAFVRPVRTWLTILALAIAVATAAMTLSIEATLSRGQDDPTLFGNEAYHLEIIPRSGAPDLQHAREAAGSTEGVSAIVTESWFLGDLPGRTDPVILRALAGDAGHVLPTDIDAGRPIQGPGEVMLTTILARQLGLGVGDTFAPTVSYFAGAEGPEARKTLGEVPLRVVGIYTDSDDGGRQALLLTSTFTGVELAEVPSSVGLRVANVRESEQVKAALTASLGPGFEVFDELAVARDDLASASSDTRPALLGLTALLVVIAVANVLSTLLFAMRERYREVGVLKAVGFAPSDIARATAIGAMVLACVAVVIGIPAGLWITERLFDHFGAEEGWTPGVAATPPAWQLALLVPASLAVAVAGALLPARRAASVSAADALRFE